MRPVNLRCNQNAAFVAILAGFLFTSCSENPSFKENAALSSVDGDAQSDGSSTASSDSPATSSGDVDVSVIKGTAPTDEMTKTEDESLKKAQISKPSIAKVSAAASESQVQTACKQSFQSDATDSFEVVKIVYKNQNNKVLFEDRNSGKPLLIEISAKNINHASLNLLGDRDYCVVLRVQNNSNKLSVYTGQSSRPVGVVIVKP